jgi:hypothetical protein
VGADGRSCRQKRLCSSLSADAAGRLQLSRSALEVVEDETRSTIKVEVCRTRNGLRCLLIHQCGCFGRFATP